MAQVSAKLRSVESGFAHWCPGCDQAHIIAVSRPNHCNAIWTFDGNVDAPTFSPSINITWGGIVDEDGNEWPREVCHYFIRGGQIEFCGDSTHALAGQTVPLPDLPPHARS